MSLRIKIPKSSESQSQPATSSSGSINRKTSSKRPLVYSDEEEQVADQFDTRFEPSRAKRSRTVDTDELGSAIDVGGIDIEVDIDGDLEPATSTLEDTRFLAEDPMDVSLHRISPSPIIKPTTRDIANKYAKKTSSVSRTKKRKQVVYSDDDGEDVDEEDYSVEDNLLDDGVLPDAGDDNYELEVAPKRSGPSKAKGSVSSKSKFSKGKTGALKNAKGKASAEKGKDKEIFMKDERKLSVPAASRASSAAGPASDLIANGEPTAVTPSTIVAAGSDTLTASQYPKDGPESSVPKRRKLPTIKKTKQPGLTSTAASGHAAPPSHKPPLLSEEIAKPAPPTAQQRKQALTGVREVDLADSKVYDELFRGGGGNTPRSGLNRREKEEERRRELDKMRDEARARRTEEAKFTFDLQSQADKVARFEQRLRGEKSTVLHPNFLAAKFRDEWESEKRRGRRVDRGVVLEEGEA